MGLVEAIVDQPANEGSFSNACVSNDDEFEGVIESIGQTHTILLIVYNKIRSYHSPKSIIAGHFQHWVCQGGLVGDRICIIDYFCNL